MACWRRSPPRPSPYLAEKKPDQKVVDALLKHKLVKKGKKDEKTKSFYVEISQAGKKFLGASRPRPPRPEPMSQALTS